RNILERMMILGEESADLPSAAGRVQAGASTQAGFILPEGGLELEEMEKELVRQALERTGGNQQQAGRLLGISRDALRRRIEKFGLKCA
ncbi:MAG: helix-turn-helix domain-containing protein, partial [Elusimicrobiota bacterium]